MAHVPIVAYQKFQSALPFAQGCLEIQNQVLFEIVLQTPFSPFKTDHIAPRQLLFFLDTRAPWMRHAAPSDLESVRAKTGPLDVKQIAGNCMQGNGDTAQTQCRNTQTYIPIRRGRLPAGQSRNPRNLSCYAGRYQHTNRQTPQAGTLDQGWAARSPVEMTE